MRFIVLLEILRAARCCRQARAFVPVRLGAAALDGRGPLDTDHPYFGEAAGYPILRGTTPVPASVYSTETFAEEAAGFIRRWAGQPFFLYVPFTATHSPLQARPDVFARLGYIADSKRRLTSAVLSSLDEGVGRILAELQVTGVAERTAVVYLGDNGCTSTCRNRPPRGGKGTWWEGAIRVPFVLAWPGLVPAGVSYGEPVVAMDLFATFLRAAGANPAIVADLRAARAAWLPTLRRPLW